MSGELDDVGNDLIDAFLDTIVHFGDLRTSNPTYVLDTEAILRGDFRFAPCSVFPAFGTS